MKTIVLLALTIAWSVQCLPLDLDNELTEGSDSHRMSKRFINPSLTLGKFSSSFIDKIRTKRSLEEDCEKLKLCKLHARSQRNFIAAFELYFVSKENARLWDHRQHSIGDCERRFTCYR